MKIYIMVSKHNTAYTYIVQEINESIKILALIYTKRYTQRYTQHNIYGHYRKKSLEAGFIFMTLKEYKTKYLK